MLWEDQLLFLYKIHLDVARLDLLLMNASTNELLTFICLPRPLAFQVDKHYGDIWMSQMDTVC